MKQKDFHTFSSYMKDNNLTASMEDYLEMIFRLSQKRGFVRIHELSDALHIQPPSATKMVQKLSEYQLLEYEKYGVIILKEHGVKIGEALLKRHMIVEQFLRFLGVDENVLLDETEKIEHTVSPKTLKKIEHFCTFWKARPDILDEYKKFILKF